VEKEVRLNMQTNVKTRSITSLVIAICWFTIFAEGYDLGIYGAVLPTLMEYKDWALSPAQAGAIGSYSLMGMLIGAVLVGTITDLIGRKKTLVYCLVLFSITMGLAAMANSPEMFGLYRFIGGIGLGGVIPTISALTIEYSPPSRRSFLFALMYTGYPLGGMIGAFLAILMLQDFGWRVMFWIGVIPLLIVPVIIKYLPESIGFLVAKNRRSEAKEIANRYNIQLDAVVEQNQRQGGQGTHKLSALASLFTKSYILATLLFWMAFFMGLLMVYGLNTWLPKMMKQAGYPLGSSISFLLVLNLTAAIGSIIAGAAADRWGSRRVVGLSYLFAGICIGLLSVKSNMFVTYLLVGIAGSGTIGSTLLLNAFLSKYFTAENRATALGWALGFGRIGAIIGPFIGGLLMTWEVDLKWNFYTFAIAGLLAFIAVYLIPKKGMENI
jgi:AAHS family benzoate transporter-like MFS transporter